MDYADIDAHLARAEEQLIIAGQRANQHEAWLAVALAAEHVKAAVAVAKRGTAQSVVDVQERLDRR
jgi:hypothetical protein